MNKKELVLLRRFERSCAIKDEWRLRDDVIRYGRVTIHKSSGSSSNWDDNSVIKVRDQRTGTIVLTFVYQIGPVVAHSGPVPYGYAYLYHCWSGSNDDENLIAAWPRDEFSEVFSEENWRCSLDFILSTLQCRMCTAWTGGGSCLQCTKRAAQDLYERMK